MAKITIDHISIENLGPFRERQTLDLSVSGGRSVILVKALNGSGKTTLLTALQIGLYGQKALSTLRRSEYEALLLGMQRKDATTNAYVEIGVTVEMGGGRRRLLVRREWRRKSLELVEELSVYENDVKDLEFSQTWDEFIGSILPGELVQLFLFDGEKIEALANPDRLPELLKRATEVFLGIGGIEELGNDLKALERRTTLKSKNASSEFEAARASVSSWEAQSLELTTSLQGLIQDQAAAKNAAEVARGTLEKFTNDAQRRGLAAYEQAAAIRSGVVSRKSDAVAARTALTEAMSNATLPVAWLTKLWPTYCTMWEGHQHTKHAKLLSQEFKKRDHRILASLGASVPKASFTVLKKLLEEDLQASFAPRRSGTTAMLDAPPKDVERQVQDAKERLRRDLAQLRASQALLDRAEQEIGQIPAEEQLGDLLRELQELSREASTADALLAEISRRIEEVHSNLTHVGARLKGAEERLKTEFRDQSLEAKGLDAAGRARKALGIFKDRLLASKAQWLSEMITAEFRNLLRKRNLVGKVNVDPVSYRVSIQDGQGRELPMDRLSAGERQLLAISVLSALIKERKGRFPVVVDTPLARLDQQHRLALIKRFFATVSHQVVVLSTDQEVDGLAYEALQPHTKAEYVLDFDDVQGRTTVHRLEKEAA
ncbi:MAG: sulfur modification protein DndD [Ramlibacter sp.]|nr:sulfur modification protein DndD [Ramlibacter sp.]